PPWLSSCETFRHATQWSASVQAGDILWIPAGWFHTLKSKEGSAAVSIFNRGMTVVPELVVSLLGSHLFQAFRESAELDDAQDALADEILRAHPDLDGVDQSEESNVGEAAANMRLAQKLEEQLHKLRPTGSNISLPSGSFLSEALAAEPQLELLAAALRRKEELLQDLSSLSPSRAHLA
ncbi:unnamed protein product, partial [Symbiodinium pilosum]